MIPTIDLHHPNMTAISIFGIEDSSALSTKMSEQGFVSGKALWDDCVAYRRVLENFDYVPALHLDAKNWRTSDDVYKALFTVLGSPNWHGKNFNALRDSIITGQINRVEVPYRLTIHQAQYVRYDVRSFLSELSDLIADFEDSGCPVSLAIKE